MARVGALITPFIAQVKSRLLPRLKAQEGDGEPAFLLGGPSQGQSVRGVSKEGCCCLFLEERSGSALNLPLAPEAHVMGDR